MQSGEMFWWAALYALPLGGIACFFLIPLWRMGKFSSWKCLLTGFETGWMVNFFGMWVKGDAQLWKVAFVDPFCRYVGAVGVAFFLLWLSYVGIQRFRRHDG